jgi:undecaprenyl-diphosphatase
MKTWHRPEGWGEFVGVIAVVAFCALTWLFIGIAEEIPGGEHVELERSIMRAFRGADGGPIGPHWLPDAVRDLTALGSAVVLILLVLLILGYLCLRRQFAAALFIALATAGGEGLNTLLKESFQRTRPDFVPHLTEVKTLSFPSGHAMAASIFYLTICAVLAQTAKRRREKIYIVGAGVLLTLLTGLSRIYLGVHFPSDVVAGWAAGAAWAILCWGIARWFDRRGKLKEAAA